MVVRRKRHEEDVFVSIIVALASQISIGLMSSNFRVSAVLYFT